MSDSIWLIFVKFGSIFNLQFKRFLTLFSVIQSVLEIPLRDYLDKASVVSSASAMRELSLSCCQRAVIEQSVRETYRDVKSFLRHSV